MGLTPTRLYVELDQPRVDLKVYVADLEAQAGCRYGEIKRGVSLVPDRPETEGVLRVGDPVTLYVGDYDDHRQRWRFFLDR